MDKEEREIVEGLRQAILRWQPESAEQFAQRAVESGIDPLEASRQMAETIRQVGRDFGKGTVFLPELVAAGAAMQKAMEIIQEEIGRQGKEHESKGLMLIGTVLGDVHDIGKNMVATLTRSVGFEVIDLGVNVNAQEFVDAVKDHKPDILALSALMTTTIMEQKKIIKLLKESALRDEVKIMVGGAAVTQEFADQIGADGYEPTAPRAAELAIRLVS